MAYREITVIEIKEVLRLWLQNRMGLRPIAATVGVDRKTPAPSGWEVGRQTRRGWAGGA